MRRHDPTDVGPTSRKVVGRVKERAGALVPLCLLVACLGAQNAIAATLLPGVFDANDATDWFSANYAFFFAANLVGVVVGGVFGRRHAPHQVMVWGVSVLIVGAALVATAASIWSLLAGRAAQGLGGGIAIVVAYVAIGSGFPPRGRPGALAAISTGWVVATIAGPLLAAMLAEATSWRAAYMVLALVIAVAGTSACVSLRDVRTPADHETARPVLLVLVPAAAVLLIGLELGHGAVSVALLGALAAILAAGLSPLLPIGTYRLRNGVAAAIALRGVLMGAFAATELWLPFVLVEVRDVGTVAAGGWISLGAAGWACGAFTYARSVRDGITGAGRVRSARAGSLTLALGAAGQCLVLLDGVPLLLPLALWLLAAYGLGLALVPLGTSLYEESPVERYPMNAAALQLADVSVAAVIIGFGSTLTAVTGPAHQVNVVAGSFVLAAACAALAGLCSTRIRSPGRN